MKHWPSELQTMARFALIQRASGNPRWALLVLQLILRTKYGRREIEQRIENIADGRAEPGAEPSDGKFK